ncbi:MAG: DNA gyrase/topoisomerase IV subunit A [Bacteroidales bacterium]
MDENITNKFEKVISDGTKKYKLSGMFREWFLDYSSYVILERAVPNVIDGLKPVQRRILHAMKLNDDGRYNKVATLVGATMPFHPHGDASIKDALVGLGQKELLIDCQGNWGNILTGDRAAAGRYIEARLTEFAKEVVFNNKTTEWVSSYDGRNQEPVYLPVKFPLLLAQGSVGVAVGLSTNILPHNFNELIDASISYLEGKPFILYPDFPTGGQIDVDNYNDGRRGGRIRCRAVIDKLDKNTLVIREIPFTRTTSDIIDSVLRANDKGKIKIKKIDDNTSENAEIIIQLNNDTSPDKTIDALYATTDCEVSLSPNACIIHDNKPEFIGISDVLKISAETTRSLLKKDLEIKLSELEQDWHYTSLEKIFFENKVYQVLENNARTWEKQLSDVKTKMNTYKDILRRKIDDEDINKLVEKPVRKISKFDIKVVDAKIKKIENSEKEIKEYLANITKYTINYYKHLKEKYGKGHERKTEVRSFLNIEVTKVVASNAKLYANITEGFIGMSQKKIDGSEFIEDCSDIDEIIVFLKDGKYKIIQISDKTFVGKNIIHVAVFHKDDTRTVYNVIYRDGRGGTVYAKRFQITSYTRDKEYDLTKGTETSSILWFTFNPNGEAETIKVMLRPRAKLKKLIINYDFANLAIKNKGAQGNIVTKNSVQKIVLKSAGIPTIHGKPIWFDWDVNRLNEDNRGELLGEFKGDEHLLVICKNGTFYTTNLDLSNRYPGDIFKIKKLDVEKVFSVVYWDNASKYFYIKRFNFVESDNTVQSIISESSGSYLHSISQIPGSTLKISFKKEGKKQREDEIIDLDDFIAVKGCKAKGKRATYYPVKGIELIQPEIKEEKIAIDLDGNSGIDGYGNTDDNNDADSLDIFKEDNKGVVIKKKKAPAKTFRPGTIIDLNEDGDDGPTLF